MNRYLGFCDLIFEVHSTVLKVVIFCRKTFEVWQLVIHRWGGDSNPYKFAGCSQFSAGERMAALPPHHTLLGYDTLNLSIKRCLYPQQDY
jgi:hypothetical protein